MDNAWRVKDVLSWLNINSEDDRYVSDLFINAEKCIKKEALPPPPERAEGSLTGPLAPRQNGQRNNPKIIIQFFFCVVNTALLPHFVPVVIPHFLPHFAPLPQQNAKAGKAFSYAVF